MKEDAEWLRNNLNQAMREQGWTCEHWARQAGIAPTTLTRFMNKQTHHVLSTSTLLKLEKAIGRPLLGSVVEEHQWEHQEAVQNNRKVGIYIKSCREKTGYTQRRLAVELNLQHYGKEVGIKSFRKHLGWYSKSIENSNEFRFKINKSTNEVELKKLINVFF